MELAGKANPLRQERRETLCILALTLLGAIVRLWSADRLGLSHFDEGIYAKAGDWAFLPGGYAAVGPAVQAYAPPGYPLLIGVASLALGRSDIAAIGVALACGILTIPAVGWLGWRTFGPGAGAASAAFAALSGPHAVFSRMAMTDAPFLLAWLVAIGLGQRFLERPGWARAVAFGVLVGVAQNFKYNGWITGAIIAGVAVLGLLGRPRDGLRALAFGLVAAVCAALVYFPWYAFVEGHGGYAHLLAHQRSYLGGWSSWWPHWQAQLAQAVALSGGGPWASWACVVAGIGAAWVGFSRPETWRANRLAWVVVGLAMFGASALALSAGVASWWLALGWAPFLFRGPEPARRVVGVWWAFLVGLTPFYHPYARLWLPIEAVGWLIAGGVMSGIMRAFREGEPTPRLVTAAGWAMIAAVGLGLVFRAGSSPRAQPLRSLLGPTDGLRQFADREVGAKVDPRRPIVIRTFASPALSFYLERHASVARQATPEAAIPAPGSGEWGLIDDALISGVEAKGALPIPVERAESFVLALPAATLLDIHPGAASGPMNGVRRTLWLFRPGASAR